jgi:RNA polymerase sigma factor (sigma-70 family)
MWNMTTNAVLDSDPAAMVKANMGLVYSSVRKYVRSKEQPEDLPEFSDGLYGLFLATAGFKPELGWKFSTYAIPIIRRMISRGRKNRNKLQFSSISELTEEVGISDISLPSIEKVMEVIERGDKFDSEIFKDFFLNDMSQAEIAAKHKISQQWVAMRLKRVKKLLAEYF